MLRFSYSTKDVVLYYLAAQKVVISYADHTRLQVQLDGNMLLMVPCDKGKPESCAYYKEYQFHNGMKKRVLPDGTEQVLDV